jgi:hypothetical protein
VKSLVPRAAEAAQQWLSPAKLQDAAIPAPVRRIIEKLYVV